jgi:hypothetical protein
MLGSKDGGILCYDVYMVTSQGGTGADEAASGFRAASNDELGPCLERGRVQTEALP